MVRATLYRIAAALFERPSPRATRRLRFLVASLLYRAPADAPWLEPLAAIAENLGHEQRLMQEHTRLFVLAPAGVAAQPYESYWAEQATAGCGRRVAMREVFDWREPACCDRCGLAPDHLVTELELMACLIERSARGEQTLLAQRLNCWVPRFLAALRRADPAPSGWYLSAADFLERLLRWDGRNGAAGLCCDCPSQLHSQPPVAGGCALRKGEGG